MTTLPGSRSIALALLAAALAGGCGSSGGGNGDGGGGQGGAPGTAGGALTWKEGGASRAAMFVAGARARSAGSDLVQITGSDSTGVGLSFGVSTLAPPLTTGSVTCGATGATAPFASFAYTTSTASSLVPICTINLTTLGETSGARAAGTFSATLPLDSGGTVTLTDGVFDVVLTVSSI